MQDLMEESGAYVFLTHEVNAAVHRDTTLPALLPDANPFLPSSALFEAALRRLNRSCNCCDGMGEPGAGEGIRTLDPNLGKVVLYP